MDPQLFSRINDFADELLKGRARAASIRPSKWRSGSRTMPPRLQEHLAQVQAQSAGKDRPRVPADGHRLAIQAGLGRFFGAKFRSGVLYRIHERTGDRAALEESLKQYRAARAAWAELANRAKGVYVSDITVARTAAVARPLA